MTNNHITCISSSGNFPTSKMQPNLPDWKNLINHKRKYSTDVLSSPHNTVPGRKSNQLNQRKITEQNRVLVLMKDSTGTQAVTPHRQTNFQQKNHRQAIQYILWLSDEYVWSTGWSSRMLIHWNACFCTAGQYVKRRHSALPRARRGHYCTFSWMH